MRTILLSLGVFSGIILCVMIWNLDQKLRSPQHNLVAINVDLKGFETTALTPGLSELKAMYVTKIQATQNTAQNNRRYWIWISLLVSALTAASTLVASIKAAKEDEANAKKALILIAVFTFFASIGNWGAGQLSEGHNLAVQKATKLSEHRVNFYSTFQRATDEAQKAEVVQQYQNDLDTM